MASSCTVARKEACKDLWGWDRLVRELGCHHRVAVVQGEQDLPRPRTSHTLPRMLVSALAEGVCSKGKGRARDKRKRKAKDREAKDPKDRGSTVTDSVQGSGELEGLGLGAPKMRFTSKGRKGTLGIRRAPGKDSTLILGASNTGNESCCFIPFSVLYSTLISFCIV